MKAIEEIMRMAPVIPVLVVDDVAQARPLAEALVAGGLRVLEVTLRTAVALDVIRAMADVPGGVVGAGTLLTPADVKAAKAAGAKRAMLLPVSAPFHSSLLKPAAEVLQGALAGIEVRTPQVPVINNVDVAIEQAPDAIRDALVRQAWHAVRWVEIIQAMRGQGITHVVECGPGKVLTGMVKRIDPDLVALSVTDPESMQAALDALAAA